MAENNTNIEITVYSGVPFNTKYQNVLFVSKETRNSFLANYDVSSQITLQRFSLIDDGTPYIDVSNDYDGMTVNYVRVFTTIWKENAVTPYKYEKFYFVNDVRQITANTTRLFLEIDYFQTYFNRYDYNNNQYQIPEMKNSRVEISTDFVGSGQAKEKMSLMNETQFDAYPDISALVPKVQTYTRVQAIMHFTTTNGEFTAISQYSMAIYPATSSYPNDLKTFLSTIYSKQKFFFDNSLQTIDVINVYLIPTEFLTSADFSNFTTGYFSYTIGGQTVHADFYVSTNLGVPAIEYNLNKTYSPKIQKQCSVGTISNRIILPYTSIDYTINIKFIFGNTFQCFLSANNETYEITSDFEYSLLESSYAQYLQDHSNGLAIKNIANAINMISAIGGLASGNPASIISLTNTSTNIAGDYASLQDLKGQPLKINAQTTCLTSLLVYNGIGIFENQPTNNVEILKAEKYLGYKMNYLTSKQFVYKETPVNNVQYNFDYYKFSNVELVANINEDFKRRISEMFENGIRVWYNQAKFLQTIENKETITP